MTLHSILGGSLVCAAALLASGPLLAQALGTARATAAGAARTVDGLIVQLRDAPSHVALAHDRERMRALSVPAAAGAAAREGKRWHGVIADLAGDVALARELPALVRRDPVGESAQVLRFARPLSPAQAERLAARLAARPDVAWVAPNQRERRLGVALAPPSDPRFPGLRQQWWLQPVQGSNAHAIEGRLRGVPGFQTAWTSRESGQPGAIVAVLDTGITCHPDLGNLAPGCIGGAILPGYDFVSDSDYANDGDGRDSDPSDPGDWVSQDDRARDSARYADCVVDSSTWHGTVIAGMVAAQTDNGQGVAAMNWRGRVLPVRVAGKCGADVVDIVAGMRWAAGIEVCKSFAGDGVTCAEAYPRNLNPARIVNISFGGSAACGPAYQQAVDELRAVGAVIVAAAGNENAAPTRPASCQGAIGVGALNRDGFKTTYSNFGPSLAISTVGGDDPDGAWGGLLADSGLLSVRNDGSQGPDRPDYFFHFGTSFSAPVVAGALSLMLSVNPSLSADQITQGLALSARPHVRSSLSGFGQCSDANPGRCLCTTASCGAGILDIDQALIYAAAPGSYVRPNWPLVSLDTPELRSAVAGGPDRPANTPTPGTGGGAMSAAALLGLLVAAWALPTPLSARSVRRARSPRRRPRD